MSFKTELKLKGINITDKEIEQLRQLASQEKRMDVAIKVNELNETGFFSTLIMVTALARSLNELMYGIDESNLKFKLKQDFKALKRLTGKVSQQFEKQNKQNKDLMHGYMLYSDDFNELIYSHMDRINENTRKVSLRHNI
ncbi:hypothetical protein GO491_12145 [Flavobacteriaceae bacterium Ap0902]|nr:hypothetical protein [Flavobacteriaceae bacterium Ap0902]